MDGQSHSYASFLACIIFAVSLFSAESQRHGEATAYSACSQTYNCGNISKITYPFWGKNRPHYCGGGNQFELTCQNNTTIIGKQNFTVVSINPEFHSMRLLQTSLSVSCPWDFTNTSLDPSLFRYDNLTIQNLSVFYKCPSHVSSMSNITCKSGAAFFAKQDDTQKLQTFSECKVHNQILVQGEISDVVDMNGLNQSLRNGFVVQYVESWVPCLACNSSGGMCGTDIHDASRFACYCGSSVRPYSCPKRSTEKLGWRLAIAIPVAGVCGLALIPILIIYTCKKHFRIENGKIFKDTRPDHDYNLQSFMKNYGSFAPRNYSYSEVKRMTKSFFNKLGEGGYGVVYKGSLPDGRLVAVKVIRESKGSGEKFLNEVASISRTSHVNIVTLLGFCYERNKRVLIYEYMSNSSLDNFIYKRGSPNAFCTLEWKVLYQVVIGIARGLEYLHRGCNTRILHLDIKPQNILLDDEFCPKISDFGLAKICQKKQSIVSILGTRGTIGFIAPEVFNRAFGGVSHKADVYSYGMLVLEMVGGRKNYDSGGSLTEEQYFPDWIYRDLEHGKHPASSMVITMEDDEMVRKMTIVSLWCVQTNPLDRPAMSKVVEMLEGPLQSLSVPPKPTLEYPTESPVILLSNGSSE